MPPTEGGGESINGGWSTAFAGHFVEGRGKNASYGAFSLAPD